MELTVDGVLFDEQRAGGITRVFAELLPAMCALEPELHVALLASARPASSLPSHPQIVHRVTPHLDPWLRPTRLLFPLRAPLRARLIGRMPALNRESIWHSTHYSPPPAGWSGPVVVTVHDCIHERFPTLFSGRVDGYYRNLKERAIRQCDQVIAVSEATAADVRRFYAVPGEHVTVVPHGFDPLFAGGIEAAPPASPFLLFVGGRFPYKNFGVLLEAYASWPQSNEVSLVVAGPPWTRSEEAELHRLRLTGKVRLRVHPSDEDLARLYATAAGLVYPSLYEGFGLPLLEAMASGCPIIASRIPSTVEVAGEVPVYFELGVTSGDAHFAGPAAGTVSDQARESLSAGLTQALTEGRPSQRTTEGRRRAERFSWERAAQVTLGVYRDLLRRSEAPGGQGVMP
jgi:glycosyltransferase involved in cell wall biosynthesis